MKYGLVCLNLLLFILAAYLGTDLYRKPVEGIGLNSGQSRKSLPDPAANPNAPKAVAPDLTAIVKRNLFNAAVRRGPLNRAGAAVDENIERTSLDLLLKGTVAGLKDSFAVIEDPQKKRQTLYRPGDRVAGALIKEITRNRVILRIGGRDQLLETTCEPAPKGKKSNKGGLDPAGFDLPELPRLLTEYEIPENQARFRPFSVTGKQKGLLVYGVHPSSGFHRAGLKNGDVVMGVNGKKLETVNDARFIQKALESDGDIRMAILRRGVPRTIEYNALTHEVLVGKDAG